jgi:uncharacterized protein (TIGR03435 family)
VIDVRHLSVVLLMSFGVAAQTVPGQGVSSSQAPVAGPAFEVASIKPAAPLNPGMLTSGQAHLGMKIDGSRAEFSSMTLRALIALAYRVRDDQVSGPDWMGRGAERWDIVAKLPEGASTGQAPEMLQALLAERFKLTLHREHAERDVYALVVGKNGPKLKEPPPDADAPAGVVPGGPGITGSEGTDQMRMSADNQGRMVVTSTQTGPVRIFPTPQGTVRMEASKMTLVGLADILTDLTHRPVMDMTGLPGSYQMALEFSLDQSQSAVARMVASTLGAEPAEAASDPSGPTIFNAVQQLGLKLEPRKEPISVLAIDHLERRPTEN